MTCRCRGEGLDRLHEGDGDVPQAHVSQDDVDAEHERHGEDPPPRVLSFDLDEGFQLQDSNGDVRSDGGADEMDAGDGQRELEIQILQRETGSLHQKSRRPI